MRILPILLIVLSAARPVFAQQDHLKLLHTKTLQRIEEAVKQCRGVVGIAAMSLDGKEGFSINDSLSFPQASAIKVTVLMEVFKQAHEGNLRLSDRMTIDHAKCVEGGILVNFADRQSQLSIHDLCVLMIVLSDNTATNLLIDRVGMERVNTTMQSLGLKQTRLQRKMMDLKASARGEENLSTPADAARLMQILGRGEFIDRETCDAILAILRMPREVPGNIPAPLPADVSVAYKQGDILPAVLTEWALVELKGNPYILTIMSNYGLGNDAAPVFKEISLAAYEYFWRVGQSGPHGTYNDPSFWK